MNRSPTPFSAERDRICAWAAGAREASEYIAAEIAARLAEETPEESAKACLELFAFYAQAEYSFDRPPSIDNLESKARIAAQMARLPRA